MSSNVKCPTCSACMRIVAVRGLPHSKYSSRVWFCRLCERLITVHPCEPPMRGVSCIAPAMQD